MITVGNRGFAGPRTYRREMNGIAQRGVKVLRKTGKREYEIVSPQVGGGSSVMRAKLGMFASLRKHRLLSLSARVDNVLAFNKVIPFAKSRNAMGEFAPNDGSVIDESMMARAYGAPSAVRRSLGGGKAGHAVASGGKVTAALLTGRRATSLPVIRRAASRLIA
jgi:hypothetical protein